MFNQIRTIMNSASVLGYFLQVLPISLIAGIVYIVIKAVSRKRQKCPFICMDEIIRFLFVCYLTGLISLVILPANFWLNVYDGVFLGWWNEVEPFFSFGGINIVPSLVKAMSGELVIGSWVKTMLIGNILMFLPLGFFLPLITKRVDRKDILAVAVVVPLVAELFQMGFGRSFDVDDLICNFIGIVLGFYINFALRKDKKQNSVG